MRERGKVLEAYGIEKKYKRLQVLISHVDLRKERKGIIMLHGEINKREK
jgi:hypothetical protein